MKTMQTIIRIVALFWFLVFGIISPVRAQLTVSGTVSDQKTRHPLPGASISIHPKKSGTASDEKGFYKLTGLPQGKTTLRITFIGYAPLQLDLQLHKDTVINFALTEQAFLTDEVTIVATRAQEKTPVTYSTVPQEVIRENNLGKDLPYILQSTPSVVVTSDAGTGVGYTGISIRGSDLTRINVTVNGIPLNDAESQGVWFVDLPDLASSTDNIQVQRGVGTSSNGSGAFGASIHIQTENVSREAYAELNGSAGSYDTYKSTLRFGTGLLANRTAFDGRVSYLSSQGYIDRASSGLFSFHLTGGYFGKNTTLRFNILSGTEKTYQAWEGVPKDSLTTHRTFNPAGLYYDRNGQIAYYENQTDNYRQNHYQLLYSQRFSEFFKVNAALHYTHGKGYYESYRQGESFSDYGLQDVIAGGDTIRESDMVTQKWLDNDFYGITFSGSYEPGKKLQVIVGGSANQYYGLHYGKVVWAQYASEGNNERKWYENTGLKNEITIYGKATYTLLQRISLFADLQYRHVTYSISGTQDDPWKPVLDWDNRFDFFNPKTGILAELGKGHQTYFSFGVSHREPNRNNYENADSDHIPSAERLFDYELGYRYRSDRFNAGVNLYYMKYRDQLVLTGAINNVGEAIMVNVPESFRAGIEMTADLSLFKWLRWNLGITLSRNRITDFTEYVDVFDADWNFLGQDSNYLGNTDLSFSPSVLAGNSFTFYPVKGLSFSFNSKYVGKQYIDNTSSDDRSLDAYFIHGLTGNYTVHPKFLKEIGITVAVNNLFSQKYESNAWIYRCYVDGVETRYDGYFPQAPVNFLIGLSLKM